MKTEVYHTINKRRFISFVMYHYGTVGSFCEKAGISRSRFYAILNKQFKRNSPAFKRLYDLLNEALDGGTYDYDLFWR